MAAVVASGTGWALYDDGLLDIFYDGPMPDFSSSGSQPWYNYRSRIMSCKVEDSVTSVGAFSFRYFSTIISVEVGRGVRSIGRFAFGNCTGLTSITLPDSCGTIQTAAFTGCTGLKSVLFGSGLQYIQSSAFSGCRYLESLYFQNGVVSIGESAFSDCYYGLKTVTIPDSVSEIGSSAFSSCWRLEKATIPQNLVIIPSSLFRGCDRLQSVYFPHGLTTVNANAFYGCTSLSEVLYDGTLSDWSSVSILNGNEPLQQGIIQFLRAENPVITVQPSGGEYTVGDSADSLYVEAHTSDSGEIGYQWYQSSMPNDPSPEVVRYATSDHYTPTTIAPVTKYYRCRVTNTLERASAFVDSDDALFVVSARSIPPEERDTELAKDYHSINFGGLNTWKTYHLIPASRPLVAMPEVKTEFTDAPGANGAIDFTEMLDNQIHYKPREGKWEFYIVHEEIENYNWSKLWHQLLNDLHGMFFQISLDDEQTEETNKYYFGRVWLDDFASDPSHSKIVINYHLDPFSYPSLEAYTNREGGVL